MVYVNDWISNAFKWTSHEGWDVEIRVGFLYKVIGGS